MHKPLNQLREDAEPGFATQTCVSSGTVFLPASIRTQVLITALLWTLVGATLLTVGVRWAWIEGSGVIIALLPVAISIGYLKARVVLGRTAGRMIDRLDQRGEGRSVFSFLSLKSCILVAMMMGLGRLLRGGLLPIEIVGLIYTAIGCALLAGSRRLWQSWNARSID